MRTDKNSLFANVVANVFVTLVALMTILVLIIIIFALWNGLLLVSPF